MRRCAACPQCIGGFEVKRDFHRGGGGTWSEARDYCQAQGGDIAVIDTEANRAGMPDADFSSWSSPEDIANTISDWVKDGGLRPASGSLVDV